MDIVFTRSRDRKDTTLVTRRDGVRLSVPVFGKLDPIPHDLAHYVVERELKMRDGFWGSVADGAIFAGMHVLEGRQPPHARDRSQHIQRVNGRSILFAEVVVEALMRTIQGERQGEWPFPAEYVAARTGADRDVVLARLRPAAEVMCAQWSEVAPGSTLTVTWADVPLWAARQQGRHGAAHSHPVRRGPQWM